MHEFQAEVYDNKLERIGESQRGDDILWHSGTVQASGRLKGDLLRWVSCCSGLHTSRVESGKKPYSSEKKAAAEDL